MEATRRLTQSGPGPASAPAGPWGAGRERFGHRLLPLLVLVATSVVYSGTLAFDFVYDDRPQIVSNAFVQSWRFVPRYFTGHVWAHLAGASSNYYRPIFLIWLRINHALFGLQPIGWHLTSVAVHLSVTLLVYWVALRMVKDRWAALAAATVFGLHPVHIEAVAWVSGVTEPLLGLLLLSSVLCYLKQREPAPWGRGWLALSLIFYVLAMLDKETALILPMMVFTYEWILGRQEREGAGRESRAARFRTAALGASPYVALAALYLAVRAIALPGMADILTPLPLATIVFTWPSLLWFYLKLLVWPVKLTPFYDLPYVSHPGFFNFVLPAAAVVGAAILLWLSSHIPRNAVVPEWRVRESRAIAFASLWMVLPILPLLNLSLLPEGAIVSDRYLYLPSVGFALLAALAWRRIHFGGLRLFGTPAVRAVSAAALACLLAMAIATVTQSLYWANDLLLYYRGATLAPHNDVVQTNLANLVAERGLPGAAIQLYQQVLARNPNFWLANHNLGFLYYKLGKLEEADRFLSRAIQINDFYGEQFLYLGLTRFKMGRVEDAVTLIRRAIKMNPEAPGYHLALGVVLEAKGDLRAALGEFKAEIINDPQQSVARTQIAKIETRLYGARLSEP